MIGQVYGYRIRQARLLRRWKARELGAAVGWSSARVARAEHAVRPDVTEREVIAVAEALRFPVGFFCAEPAARVTAADLLFHPPSTIRAAECDRLAQLLAVAGDLIGDLDVRVPQAVPAVRWTQQLWNGDPVPLAAAARRALGVGMREPIRDLVRASERAGVAVLLRRDALAGPGADEGRLERHLGCSAWVGAHRERPVVVVRALDSWERTRWAVAHELGHLMMHGQVAVMSAEHERQADLFAAELLAPVAEVAEELPLPTVLAALVPLKLRWGLSLADLLRHLGDTGLLSVADAARLRRQLHSRLNPVTGRTWGRTEPGFDERPVERPTELGEMVAIAREASGFVSRWPPDLVDELVGAAVG